mmetsp:Transcript_20550/g.37074  ORF Transcript_20550/g.37074 Transcript_20550/m.37074 type:complete len:315 (+) Transcript_20550:244-1188(+)
MCIIFVAHNVHPKYPLIIASNRDEFLDRPTEPMKIWANDCDMGSDINRNSDVSQQQNSCMKRHRRVSLAGRDLVGGGTWLGIALPIDKNEDGDGEETDCSDNNNSVFLRWIAITNFYDMDQHGRPSRGGLLMEYLDGDVPSADTYVASLQQRGHEYNGFNLLVGDKSDIYYYGNRVRNEQSSNKPRPLNHGIYGLSNGLLDSPWPKVSRGKEMLRLLCQKDTKEQSLSAESFHEELMNILFDQTQPDSDDQLPPIGLDLSSTRYISSIFVPQGLLLGREYGTRSSTTIFGELDGKVSVLERTWPSGKDRSFQFD